jgi:hypothetical protein
MARESEITGDAVYEVTIYSYGKRYRVTGRWPSAEAAKRGARLYFRGRTTVYRVTQVRDLPIAGAEIVEKK